MTSFPLRNAFLVASGILVTLVVGWWWVVFSQLIQNGTMGLADVAPCLARDSDLCSLAQSLCTSNHFLGVRHYFAEAFWLAGGLLLASLATRLIGPAREL